MRRRGGWPRDPEGTELVPDENLRRGTVVPDLTACREHYAKEVERRTIDWPEAPVPDDAPAEQRRSEIDAPPF